MADPIKGEFASPFAEQIAFFRRKLGNLVPTQRWDDMTGAAHDDGFMVAGATKADLLSDLAAAVDKSIAEGRGVEEFRRDFRAIVAKNGWTGWTGEGSIQGEAWRVKTILRTNAYTSYSAGRYAQLAAEDWPFWVYRHGGSLEPRPVHLSWDGLALPPDHAFWSKYYPPSDWGCSCYVVGARSEAGIRRVGGDPAKKLPGNWAKPDPKTGEPKGIGKGWGYAPGASVAPLIAAMAAKVRNWDYAVGKAFLSDLPVEAADAISQAYRALPSTAADAKSFAKQIFEPGEGTPDQPRVRSLGLVASRQAEEIGRIAKETVLGFDYRFAAEAVSHVRSQHGNARAEAKRGQRAVTPSDFSNLPLLVSQPDNIAGPETSNIGELLVHLSKVIDGELVTATFAVMRRYRSLALKTMYVRPNGGRE